MKIVIISGGQTGVDRAALDSALELGFQCGGWCPKNRKAEDGPIDRKYPLKETDEDDYSIRTELNVRDSDGTLIITHGKPTGGTAYTIAMSRVHKKPLLVIDLIIPSPLVPARRNFGGGEGWGKGVIVDKIYSWLTHHNIQTLNVAGPRESNMHGIYSDAKNLMIELLNKISC